MIIILSRVILHIRFGAEFMQDVMVAARIWSIVVMMVRICVMNGRMIEMDRIERNARKAADKKRKLARNPLYRMACVAGLL